LAGSTSTYRTLDSFAGATCRRAEENKKERKEGRKKTPKTVAN